MLCLRQAPNGSKTWLDTSTVRLSPVSDGQQSRLTAVGKRQGLSHRLRMWPKKRAKTRLRILSLNVGTTTGKSRELADMLDRRSIYIYSCIACVQGSKAREIGDGYKLFYHGEKQAEIVLVSSSALAVNISDRLMPMQLVIKKGRLRFFISIFTTSWLCRPREALILRRA